MDLSGVFGVCDEDGWTYVWSCVGAFVESGDDELSLVLEVSVFDLIGWNNIVKLIV